MRFEGDSILEVPFPEPMGFNVVIEPRPPIKQVGSIAMAKRSQEADQALETVGKILAIGPKAWTDEGGLNLASPNNPVVGDWIVYRQHSGQKMRLKGNIGDADPDGSTLSKYILVMLDTDVLAKFKSLAEAEKFRSWI